MNTSTPTEVRNNFVTIGNVYEKHQSQFIYSEGSDRAELFELKTWEAAQVRLDAGEDIIGDCASTWEATREFAGCEGLPPLGWTGTELQDPKMPHIALADALEGDGIVFGEYPGKHVVWVTQSHPTNPKVALHWDPETDGHGEPGFTQNTLTNIWDSVFPGLPITVLSIEKYLPADPYHYDWYDTAKMRLPHGTNSEVNVARNYDEQRKNQAVNHASLLEIQENCDEFVTRLENVMKDDNDPKGLKYHRKFRLDNFRIRANGGVVTP